jgi:putative Ca2+/H+ antiporter (TMEM165/GDT1 family)
MMFPALLQSFLLVAVSEMGDKTQLLALMLTIKYKKPLPILVGIFFATILNHGVATWFGVELSSSVSPDILRYILATIFIGFALWILVPDKEGDLKGDEQFGAFLTTFIAFFLAEMGDKTQLATVALAARFHDIVWVTIGSTLGMMFTNGLTVLFGEGFVKYVPLKYVRWAASFLFLLFGLAILFSWY